MYWRSSKRIQLATCHCDYDLRFYKKYNFLTGFIDPRRRYLLDDIAAWKRKIRHVLGFVTNSDGYEITSNHFHVIRQSLVDLSVRGADLLMFMTPM